MAKLPEDLKQLKRKARQGWDSAQYELGRHYYHGEGVRQSYKKAIKWFRRAADQEFAQAQMALWVCYTLGRFDGDLAFEYLKKAAAHGEMMAEFNLGLCYDLGEHVPQDRALAFEYYKKAAEKGMLCAQNNVGSCYCEGIGVSRDPELAVEWFKGLKKPRSRALRMQSTISGIATKTE